MTAGQFLPGIEEDAEADAKGNQGMPYIAAGCIRMDAMIYAKLTDKV